MTRVLGILLTAGFALALVFGSTGCSKDSQVTNKPTDEQIEKGKEIGEKMRKDRQDRGKK